MEETEYSIKFKKIIKYFVMLIVLTIACSFIPQNSLSIKETTIISTIGAITFVILDMYSPSITEIN